MTLVGLYGDSFGTGSMPKLSDGSYDSGFDFHWSKILEQKLDWQIDNYAISGSSVYESYRNFLETHDKYEQIIFIATIPGRYFKPLDFKNSTESRICSIPHLESILSITGANPYTKEELETLRHLRGWYMLQDFQYDSEMCRLMINEIRKIRPDTIFMTVVPCYFDETNINEPLIFIYEQQCKQLGFSSQNPNVIENTKLMSGHFTPELNEVFAEYMCARVTTGVWPEWKLPKLKFKYTRKDYFNI